MPPLLPGDASPPRVATLTISDTRTAHDDLGGPELAPSARGRPGSAWRPTRSSPTEPSRCATPCGSSARIPAVDVVVTTGGTGISPRDRTYEAIDGLLDRRLDGFGEAFRRLSWDDVGPRAILSRALAGTVGGDRRRAPGQPARADAGCRADPGAAAAARRGRRGGARGSSGTSVGRRTNRCSRSKKHARESWPARRAWQRRRVPLDVAAGRVLAERIVAAHPLPPFDHSAMDGYAVRLADLGGDGPFELRVGPGESRAGAGAPALGPGEACPIFTGAALPRGADAVVMQEDVDRDGDRIAFAARPKPGAHVRAAGEDLRPGQEALAEGTRLSPGHLAGGFVRSGRDPRGAAPRGGDRLHGRRAARARNPRRARLDPRIERRRAGRALPAGGRRAAGARRSATIWTPRRRALDRALVGADLLLTVGGVSVGDHDLVRPALERVGVTLDFYKVAIKPGKPLVFGRRESAGTLARVLGLPGNPASAMTTFMLFAAPLLRARYRATPRRFRCCRHV